MSYSVHCEQNAPQHNSSAEYYSIHWSRRSNSNWRNTYLWLPLSKIRLHRLIESARTERSLLRCSVLRVQYSAVRKAVGDYRIGARTPHCDRSAQLSRDAPRRVRLRRPSDWIRIDRFRRRAIASLRFDEQRSARRALFSASALSDWHVVCASGAQRAFNCCPPGH